MKKNPFIALGVLIAFSLSIGANAFYDISENEKNKLNTVTQKIQDLLVKKPEMKDKIYQKLEQKKNQMQSEKLRAYIDYVQLSLTGNTTSQTPIQTPTQTGTNLTTNTGATQTPDTSETPSITVKHLEDFPNVRLTFQQEKLEVYEGNLSKLKVYLSEPIAENISVPYTFKGKVTADEMYNYAGEIQFLSGETVSEIQFIPLVDCIEDEENAYVQIVGQSTFSQKILIKDTNERNIDLSVKPSETHTGSIVISGPEQKHLFLPKSLGGKFIIYYDKQDCTDGDTVGGMATGASNAIECKPTSTKPVTDNSITLRYETGFGGVCVWRK